MRRLALLVDGDKPPVRINEPALLSAVGDPAFHLPSSLRKAVRSGEKFHHESGA